MRFVREPARPRSRVTSTEGFGGACAGGRELPARTLGIGGGGPVKGLGAIWRLEREDGGETGVAPALEVMLVGGAEEVIIEWLVCELEPGTGAAPVRPLTVAVGNFWEIDAGSGGIADLGAMDEADDELTIAAAPAAATPGPLGAFAVPALGAPLKPAGTGRLNTCATLMTSALMSMPLGFDGGGEVPAIGLSYEVERWRSSAGRVVTGGAWDSVRGFVSERIWDSVRGLGSAAGCLGAPFAVPAGVGLAGGCSRGGCS
jgi:hypothetical protein